MVLKIRGQQKEVTQSPMLAEGDAVRINPTIKKRRSAEA